MKHVNNSPAENYLYLKNNHFCFVANNTLKAFDL